MKKLFAVLAVAVLVIAGYSVAQAASISTNVPLSFSVQDEFGFTLSKYSHDFGSIPTGSGAETTVGIFCKSNHGKVWYMGIQAPEFSNGAASMPSDPGFKMAAWNGDPGGSGDAKGSFIYAGAVPSTIMYDFYQSTLAEGSDQFTSLALGLYITVPAGQAAGLYQSTMTLTMHD